MVFWHRLHPFTLVELMAEKNLFVRDFRLKQALGMPPETFGQIGKLIPVAEVAGGRLGSEAIIPHDPVANPANEFIKRVQAQAIADGDREVAAAARYNLLHLQAVALDEAVAGPALEELANTGDEFSLRWLESPAQVIPTAHEALVAKTKERIRERLKRPPEPSEKLATAWLLRAAVSDITCNPLEGPMGRFRQEWLAQHRDDPGVKQQLETVAPVAAEAAKVFSPASVRGRVRSYKASAPL
jgi:hypothetical protein